MATDRYEELLQELQKPDEADRRYAIQDLADLGDSRCIPYLIKSLDDASVAVREAAADALVTLGGEPVCSALLSVLASESVSARNYACEVLARIGSASVPYLSTVCENEKNADVVKFAIDVLGELGPRCAPYQVQVIKTISSRLGDSEENIVVAAAEALGRIGDPSAIVELEKYIHGSLWVQCAVLQAIVTIGGQASQDALGKLDMKCLSPVAIEICKSAGERRVS